MIYVNGRFLTQPVSGVQRYARELLAALDHILTTTEPPLGPVEVLVPYPVEAPDWHTLRCRVVRGGAGHFWEQVTLARAARRGVLVSLGNSGPLSHANHLLCLHDAHLYEIPQAFGLRYRIWHRLLRPSLARRARGLVTVSPHSAARLSHHLGVEAAKFEIVPNSADHVQRWPKSPDAPARHGLQKGRYLLSVGNQSANKNLGALITAHALAGSEVAPLVLVGGDVPGVAAARLRSGRIHVLGRVPDGDLRGLYEGAHGFVFASLNEGFGIPPLEAMQLGCPVLCARSGAMPSVLGDAPIWFDPRDGSDMTRALLNFTRLGDGARRAMIERGYETAAKYTWQANASALLRILREASR